MAATYNQVIEGLALLANCDQASGEAEGVHADRGRIYSAAEPQSVNSSVIHRLCALGWRFGEDGRWSIRTHD